VLSDLLPRLEPVGGEASHRKHQVLPDQRIVEAAWEYECVIVTANGRDFLEKVERFLGTTKKKEALRGIVWVISSPFGYDGAVTAQAACR
jgi:hypothetical protein